MDKGESNYKFREADTLYRQRRYIEALTLLEELDLAHPNTRRIQYPLARTFARLERYPQAIDLLEQIVRQTNYEPAQYLLEKLEGRTASAMEIDLSTFDDEMTSNLDFESSEPSSPPALPRDESPPSARFNWILGSALVLTLAVMIVGQATFGAEFEEWFAAVQEQPDSPPPAPLGPVFYAAIQALILSFIGGCAAAYCGLAVVQALPYTDYEGNLKDVALYNVFGFLLCMIPILGWIALLVILKRHYELSFGKLVVMVFMYMVVSTALGWGVMLFIRLVAALV